MTSRKSKRHTPNQATSIPRTSFQCEVDHLEGLENVVENELLTRFDSKIDLTTTQRAGTLPFTLTGALQELGTLQSVIAVYLVQEFSVPRPKALLGHQHFETLIKHIERVRRLWPKGTFNTFYLNAAGRDSAILARLQEEIAKCTGLRNVSDEGDLLLRLRRSQDGWETLIRLSPRPLATRTWRVCNFPGALNATVAHAMMQLTQPQPTDVVVNLACGSGTLLVERLNLEPVQHAIGCDIDPVALTCAQENLAAAGYADQVSLEQWDVGQLPLEDASVNVLCADLPYGQLIGSHQNNEHLYPRLFAEATRVAQPHARMALITHEVRLLEQIAATYQDFWHLEQVLRVRVSGMTPRCYFLRRKIDDM
ncbi:MAG: methyltransferase domain-containing protein [Chloroflexi bacterium AL-W]|nr:methyltransferase domain-containing protein [Chloroflexi bacterium AL-N1]NOK65595.1 methyltransferase domain-containing protein [Chloroflexi bacterium AL-N10]NOK74464.1 methyltransferase domain-containing protein [Chloroflexi bacterium AL-N5]NOK80628.1 methyltransferase domain-containing protein [Chloroflexi bacterium AL-W]NOK88722.1 methyltransferase domain-containing protein [Chloroflexi bacterium AL-N15]